jgi:hypothetical protein
VSPGAVPELLSREQGARYLAGPEDDPAAARPGSLAPAVGCPGTALERSAAARPEPLASAAVQSAAVDDHPSRARGAKNLAGPQDDPASATPVSVVRVVGHPGTARERWARARRVPLQPEAVQPRAAHEFPSPERGVRNSAGLEDAREAAAIVSLAPVVECLRMVREDSLRARSVSLASVAVQLGSAHGRRSRATPVRLALVAGRLEVPRDDRWERGQADGNSAGSEHARARATPLATVAARPGSVRVSQRSA